jgi:alpha-1,6-mannosyltransferase
MHVVDTTLFYSPTSGGVKRYLTAKHAWLRTHTSWQHSMLVPGDTEYVERGGICTVPGVKLPGTFNYRLPLNTRRWAALLDALEPDLIEVGDAFHSAWCAWRVAQRRGIPLVAFYHSNLPQIIGRRIGSLSERTLGHYVRWFYERCDVVFAPSRSMCDFLNGLGVRHTIHQPLGVDTEIFCPDRATLDLRASLGLPPETRVLVYAGRFAQEKNLPVLLQAFASLGHPYHLLMIGGEREARPMPNISLIPYRRDSIVAARASAIPELVDASVGMLAEPGSADSMAEAIVALYERDVAAVGRVARARVLRQFTWTQAFHTQTGIYANLLGTHRVPVAPTAVIELGSPTS